VSFRAGQRIALTDTASSYAYPMIAPDGTGGAVIAWIGYNGETYVQKINSAGESQWTAEGPGVRGGEVPKLSVTAREVRS